MSHYEEAAMRRRNDGSIDVDFYEARAAALRAAARGKLLARWFSIVRRGMRAVAADGAHRRRPGRKYRSA